MANFHGVLNDTTIGGQLRVSDLVHEAGEVGVRRIEVFNDNAVIGWLDREAQLGLLERDRNAVLVADLRVLLPKCLTAEPPVMQADLGAISIDLDITNGARGTVVDIVLDPEELPLGDDSIVTLKHLPQCVLVKLNRTRAARLDGLDDGIIPIFPAKSSMQIILGKFERRRKL